MAANTVPVFTATPRLGHVRTSATTTLATDRLGTTSAANLQLLVAGTNGTRIEKLRVRATGASGVLTTATVAGLVLVMYSPDNGSTFRLVDELVVTAVTPSASVAAFNLEAKNTDGTPYVIIPASSGLYVALTAANALDIEAFGGDF